MGKKYMNKIRTTVLTLFCLTVVEGARSQIVSWRSLPNWDSANILGDNMIRVSQSGKWGVVSFSGDLMIIPCEYSMITEICEERFLLLGNNYKINSLRDSKNNCITIKNRKGKMFDGDLFVDPAWPYFSEGLLAVRNSEGKWGFLNTSGMMVIDTEWSKVYPFRYGLSSARYEKGGNWCHIDKKGKHLSKPFDKYFRRGAMRKYYSSYTQIDNRIQSIVFVNDKMYMIDIAGNIRKEIFRENGLPFSYLLENDSLLSCSTDEVTLDINNRGEIQYIKKDGRVIKSVQKEYPTVDYIPNCEGLEIDSQCKIKVDSLIISPQFDEIIPLSINNVLVKKNSKWGLLAINRSKDLLKVNLEKPYQNKQKTDLEFGLSEITDNIRAYADDTQGNRTFFQIIDGKFKVPVDYIDKNNQISLGLETNGILLEPTILTLSEKTTDINNFTITWSPSQIIPVKPKSNVTVSVIIKRKEGSTSFNASINGRKMVTSNNGQVKLTKMINVKFNEGDDTTYKTIPIYIQEEGCSMKRISHKFKFVRKLED